MTWYWYVAQPNEIFCDLDTKRALGRTFGVLRRAMRRNELPVQSVYLYPSLSNYHVIVELKSDLDPILRALWALWMGSDRIRGVYVLERLRRGVGRPDVLSSLCWFDYRVPDDMCQCAEKHKAKSVTDKCPAMTRLLGKEHRSGDYFPRNFDKIRRTEPLNIPFGRVSKSQILKG